MFLAPSRALARICLAGATLGFVGVAASTVVPASASASAPGGPNPYLPSNGHTYRHGAVPTQGQEGLIRSWNAQHRSSQAAGNATGPNTLSFLGGLSGGAAAVTSTPQVYLVFWGNQWGTQITDINGNLTFSADYANGAPYIQQMLKGLGTKNELWSGTMTQYCDGLLVGLLATSCPSGAPHIGYPSGTTLAGVWYDNAGAAPSAATASQIAAEAVSGANHFANTTGSSNRYAQYVVLSAPNTDPDNYKTGGFCAWHNYTSSSVGNLAYTNMPYVMDVGWSCGAGFVNPGGTLDGYSIVEGHEYAETLTDEFPNKGWVNFSNGQETGDECAWITSGTTGAAQDVPMTTGSFAMQSTWSNDTNSCAISHAVVTGSNANTVTVTNPGPQTGSVPTPASLQISATDSAQGAQLTYSATGLPAGLSIGPSTGLISGTPTHAGSYSVTVTAADGTGAQGSASFSWTITTTYTVSVSNPGPQNGTVGTAASVPISASDSPAGPTLTYSATGLPANLTINPSTGLISGTPTTAGGYSVTVTVADTTGAQGSATFSWTITSPNKVTVTNPTTNQTGTVGTAVSPLHVTASDTGSGLPYSYSAAGLPAGLAINSSTGVISGTPRTAATYNVTVTVTDNTGASGSKSFTWTISAKRHH